MASRSGIDIHADDHMRHRRNWQRLARLIVNGTLGGLTSGSFFYGETPSGTINGVNAAFTLANAPVAGKVAVFVNGLRMTEGAGNDYTVSGATVTFTAGSIPVGGDILRVDYIKA